MRWGKKAPSEAITTLTRNLAGTTLAGRPLIELPVPGLGDVALAAPVESAELETVWREARGLLDVTNRWPLAVTSWAPESNWESSIRAEDMFSRFYFNEATPPLSAAEILGAAAQLSDADIDALVERSREAREQFEAENPTQIDLQAPLPDPWFDFDQHAALVFLPWRSGWDSLAYINFYGSSEVGIAETIALGRRWEKRYGAELVAHLGTMLECLVARPPADLATATDVAREQFAVAADTFYLPGEPPASVAPALIDADRWLLHQRP